ncbi:SAC3 family protein B isoform X2 [Durio zibethinus]|uniref:SAC3 family protein B isoform X2 n=1 Tax=Durio zibethinus TaxID=66656 RepID=A0A6P5X396_DURZI|nr:SAC3 family protein B isoform X2 [Durio zibethinus]
MSGFGKHSGPTTAPKSANPFQFQRPPPTSSTATIRPFGGIEAVDRVRSPAPAFENSSPAVRPYQYGGVQRPVESPPRWADGQISLKDYNAQTHLGPPAVTSFVASRNSETSVTAKIARFQEPKRAKSPPSLSVGDTVPRYSSQMILQRPLFQPHMQHNPVKLPTNYPSLPTHQDQSVVSYHVGPPDYRKSFVNEVSDTHAPKQGRLPPTQPTDEVTLEHHQFVHNVSKRPSGSPPRLGTKSNIISPSSDVLIHPRSLPSSQGVVSPAVRNIGPPVSKRTRSPPLIYRDEFLQENASHIEDDTERELQAKAKRLARFKAELSENVQMNPPDISDERLSANRFQHNVEERKKLVGEHSADSDTEFLNDSALSDFEGMETSRVIIGLCPDMCPESERAERERKGDLDQYERLDGDRNQTSEYLAVKKYNRTAEREASLIRPMSVLQKTIDYLLNLLDQPYDDRFLGIYNFLWDRMRAIRMDLRMQHIFDQEAITMLEQMIRLHIIAMHELCEYTKGEGFSEGFDAHLNIEQMNKTSVELFQMYDDHRKKGINIPTEKEFRGYYALLKLDKHPGYKVEPAELSLDLVKMTPEIRQTPEVLFARDVARACRTGNFVAFFRLARRASYLQACLMHAHFAKLRTQALASLHSSLQNNQGLPVTHVARWLGIEEEEIESILDYYGFSIKEFEEPYMVKEGSFLNVENDYPTKCSRLVHRKRSRTIAGDVAVPCQATSMPVGVTKASQLGKIYKKSATALSSPRRASSIVAVDEEMPESKVVPSPKDGVQLHSVTETSIGVQQLQDGHLKSSKPFNFPLARGSPRSVPAKVAVLEKANNDAFFTILRERTIISGMEKMPLQNMSQASPLERSPSGVFDHAVENRLPQSMAIDNVKSLPLRSPSGKYDYITKNSVPQTMAVSGLTSTSERLSDKYDYDMENLVPHGMAVNNLGDKPLDCHQEIKNREIAVNNQHKEVAEAKLKLMLRLWSRRAAKKRELREQRQLAAEAALSSLPLGIPVWQNKDQWSTFAELEFDHVMRERCEKHESSWTRLNVSDVVSGILGKRNPDAKCLCWKIILCSPESKQGDQLKKKSQVAHLTAGTWLFSKIMPSTEDNSDVDLAVSSPGLSIWKKWVPSLSGTDLTCCLSVVKDANCDNLDEAVSGASAILFLVSSSIPWKLQKVQLHNLLTSITPGSCLPLLVLSGSYHVEGSNPSSVIINELGLHNVDKSQVSSFLVIFLVGKQHPEHSNGFFSDEQLREGLKWLANESPLQPVLSSVKTRELVMSHLSPLSKVLDKMSDYEVDPNHCISVFNEALDWSLGEISAVVKANPTNWPCPEIMLLEDSSDELLAVKLFLPSVGWSSTPKTAPLECALRDCRLPSFPDDLSWLQRGSNMGKDIDNQILLLEKCLIGYLTHSSKMMGIPLATKETSVMLQRNTRLELHSLSYYLVPNWITIFQRIFNWRLMSLSTGACSLAYVLQCHHVAPKSVDSLKLQLKGDILPCCLSHPSLDEIIEVGCSPLKSHRIGFDPEPSQVETAFHIEIQDAATPSISTKDRGDSSHKHGLDVADDVACTTNKSNSSHGKRVVAGTETDRLSQLLEKCNIVQNSIGEKLSIYF